MAGVGYYRFVMTVQNPVRTLDAFGQLVESWLNAGVIRANAERIQSTEVMDDQGPAVRTDWTIEATWFPNVSSRSRLVWNDHGTQRTFNIRGAWDRDGRRRRLEIEATEVLP